ncbi:bark leucoagglutinin-like [Vigna unguiculata]|uniref:Lectin n=1 Tax=Vigna unguiculata TaxID=3917 RepID=A0A4D6KWS3_VIGUN|nr:bark leucoagglutinin-like [Vigna unguiculata]QCD81952.1 Lectin [Vigna unguiculata]
MAALFNTRPVFMLLVPLLLLHRSLDTSFTFPNFSAPYLNSLLAFEGDASSSKGVIQLTKVQDGRVVPNSVGRATYALPVRLWDAQTGKVASFATSFSFNISYGRINGDGIAFFLGTTESTMPLSSFGGYLGLFDPKFAFRDTDQNQIVAVEFDMHQNPWDPPFPHVGIDVNSISSVESAQWESNPGLITAFVTVTYEAAAQSLSVVVKNGPTISLMIDLKTVLPEWVRVGFSGATGRLTEVHQIQSWTFSSSFD